MAETLDWTTVQWREQAALFEQQGNSPMAETCERAAVSLEIERDTGVAVCTCCFKPFSRGVHI